MHIYDENGKCINMHIYNENGKCMEEDNVFYDTFQGPVKGNSVFYDTFQGPVKGYTVFYDTFQGPVKGYIVFYDTFQGPGSEKCVKMKKKMIRSAAKLIFLSFLLFSMHIYSDWKLSFFMHIYDEKK